jgi:hypothetical protein
LSLFGTFTSWALCFDCLPVMIEGNWNVWVGKLAWSCRACWYQVEVTVHWSLYNSIYELTLLSPPGNYFLHLFICAISELALLNSMLPNDCRICLMLMARTGRNFLLWLKCRVKVKKVSLGDWKSHCILLSTWLTVLFSHRVWFMLAT